MGVITTEKLGASVGAGVKGVDTAQLLHDAWLPAACLDALQAHRSGRPSLVLAATTDHVIGMGAHEGRARLDELLARWTTRDRVHPHEWSVGDVVIWDDRGVLHRACPYDPASPASCTAPPSPATSRPSDGRRRRPRGPAPRPATSARRSSPAAAPHRPGHRRRLPPTAWPSRSSTATATPPRATPSWSPPAAGHRPDRGRDRPARSMPRSRTCGDASAPDGARQQCRARRLQPVPEDQRREVEPHPRGQPHGHVPLLPGRRPRHDRRRLGPDREHLVVERPGRPALHDALRGGQGGRDRLHQGAGARAGPAGITVNTIPPGFVDTPMLRRSEAEGLLGEGVDHHASLTPVRRARPEDIAAACAFLVRDEAGYITGQVIGVNGGRNTWHARRASFSTYRRVDGNLVRSVLSGSLVRASSRIRFRHGTKPADGRRPRVCIVPARGRASVAVPRPGARPGRGAGADARSPGRAGRCRTIGKDFTVQDVVERCGQSLRSFYQYFAGYHELLLALFEESARRRPSTCRRWSRRSTIPSSGSIASSSSTTWCAGLRRSRIDEEEWAPRPP